MGYYIEVPEKNNKAEQLVKLHGGEIIERPSTYRNIPKGKALICVVSNSEFDAAGFCYSPNEFEAFLTDFGGYQRPRKWVLMDLELTKKLTGIPNYLIHYPTE